MKRKYFNSLRLVPYVFLIMVFVNTGFSQLIWQRTYGGADNDYGYSVQQTLDGGYIVAGVAYSFGSSAQIYLIKTDSLGDTLWTKTYGGSADDLGMSVQQTTDGGYIIAGTTNSFGASRQVYLIKTDSLGDTLWTKTYGGVGNDLGTSVQQTTDRGYVIAGTTNSFGNSTQVYLIKTDSLGDTLWTKTYGGTIYDRGYSVQQTQDRGYIIGGEGNSSVDHDPIYLIKTDSLGDTLWTRTYCATFDEGRSVQQTQDGGYIIAGIRGFNGIAIYLVKTDSLGDTLWIKAYRWEEAAWGYSVQQTQDSGYIVAGEAVNVEGTYEYNYFYLVKTDSLGDTIWTKTYGTGMTEGARCVQQTTDGGYILVGSNAAFGNGWQVWLIKTDEFGNGGIEDDTLARHLSHTSQLMIYPNPFSSFTTVIGYEKKRFILYDISGRRVGSYLGDRIGFGLPAGVYFLMPEDKSFKPVRVVKVR